MPINRYNHTMQPGVKKTQNLLDSLNREAIQMAGLDMYYLPRDVISDDEIFDEDIQSRFDNGYAMEMYIESSEGFEGQELLFKFGVEVRDEVSLVVNKKRFNEALASTPHESLERPREGDLIYIPLSKGVYQIMFVEHEQPFYQLGTVPNYIIRAQLFEYSGEDFDTDIVGLDIPDSKQNKALEADGYVYKVTLNAAADYEMGEEVSQTVSGVTVTGEIVRISDNGQILHIAHIKNNSSDDSYKVIIPTAALVGAESGVSQTVTAVQAVMETYSDNDKLQEDGAEVIDTSESSNFGFDI